MSSKVWQRKPDARGNGFGSSGLPYPYPASSEPISHPPDNLDVLKKSADSFILASFTADDAWHLGNLLRARLLHLAGANPCIVSISLANSSQVLFQCVTGSGTSPDNEDWVRRKRNAVMRWGSSTYLLHCKFGGSEEAWAAKYGLSKDQANQYTISGGGVPIRVQGVEGVVAVVIVSGLKHYEDHGVIVDVIREHWE